MELIVEVILGFLGEIFLQAIVELILELGFHGVANTVKKRRNPALSAIGFILIGAMAGGISLLIFPDSLLVDPRLRLLNLAVTPVIVGLLMMLVGRIRDRKGQDLVKLDRFGYAFAFAFSMSLVRFLWAG